MKNKIENTDVKDVCYRLIYSIYENAEEYCDVPVILNFDHVSIDNDFEAIVSIFWPFDSVTNDDNTSTTLFYDGGCNLSLAMELILNYYHYFNIETDEFEVEKLYGIKMF